MGFRCTFIETLIRMLMPLVAMVFLSGCMIDDPPPCTIQDDVAADAACSDSGGSNPFSFKVEYTAADGHRPDGKYSYVESSGLTTAEAEAEAKMALQIMLNTSSSYVATEVNEISYYRGNICGSGYRLKSGLSHLKVKRMRKIGSHSYDYDLELTCTN